MSGKKKPSKEQVTEWFESPVTEYFFSLISELKEATHDALADQGFDTDSSERLMAQRGNLFGMQTAFEQVEDLYEAKSFQELEEEESGEQVGHLPESRSGAD